MSTAMLIVHFTLAVFVVAVILFQGPKGEGLGAIGGSARLFHGPRPRETLMLRVTSIVSLLFIGTSVYLAFVR